MTKPSVYPARRNAFAKLMGYWTKFINFLSDAEVSSAVLRVQHVAIL